MVTKTPSWDFNAKTQRRKEDFQIVYKDRESVIEGPVAEGSQAIALIAVFCVAHPQWSGLPNTVGAVGRRRVNEYVGNPIAEITPLRLCVFAPLR